MPCRPVPHGFILHGRACRILQSDGGVGYVLRMCCGELLGVRVVGLFPVSCGNLLEYRRKQLVQRMQLEHVCKTTRLYVVCSLLVQHLH